VETRKLLLTSVFKPFAVDDAYGVKENIPEPMHNQVTRRQRAFSIRSNHRSFGLTLIAENIQIPTTVLDYPTEADFIKEISTGAYSHIGISLIVSNLEKAARMAELVRQYAPRAVLWLGNHGTAIPDIDRLVPNQGICRGEGVRWVRERFGEPHEAPLHHPIMPAWCWRELFGVPLPMKKAVLLPGVGCKNRCSFCCTSHFFNGYVPFLRSADEMFDTCVRISDRLKTNEFLILDENFLDDPHMVHRLLELMEQHQRRFTFEIFASLKTIAPYDPFMLMRLGIQFVWIGIESRHALFEKVRGIDASQVVKRLRDHGIMVLCSTIVFHEHQDHRELQADVNHVIDLAPDLIQFMELGPLPGTALYDRLEAAGRIRHDVPFREWHGQGHIWFQHPNFPREGTKKLLDEAFDQEFQALGPSLMRVAETRLNGLKLPPPPPDDLFMTGRRADLRERATEMRALLPAFIALAPNEKVRAQARHLMAEFARVLGAPSLAERASGALMTLLGRFEERRVRLGRTVHQPPTFRDIYRQGPGSLA
jgi:hypothetical protein